MHTETLGKSRTITVLRGLELKELDEGRVIFQPHDYVGKEPDSSFVYSQIKVLADKLGIPPYLYLVACPDEVQTSEHIKRSMEFTEVFSPNVIGSYAFNQPTKVALGEGHASKIIEVNTHMGVYQHQKDRRILAGYVESRRDHALRPTCGALSHVMNRFLGKEKADAVERGEIDFISLLEERLSPFKQEFLEVYSSGGDDAEKFSRGMEYLARKNCEVHAERAVTFVKKKNLKEPVIVYGTITLNRFKYPTTMLLMHVYMVKGETAYDLTKTPVPLT